MNPPKFARIAESLRQYRRAELKEFEEELGSRPVDTLYVDPLPSDAILNSVLSSNTTFLLGRKGTGKSTIFAKAQNELRTMKNLISTYIDVKSLCDIIDASEIPICNLPDVEIDGGIYRAHMLRKAFLGTVLAELLKEIDNTCNTLSVWDKWRGRKKPLDELRKSLSTLQHEVKESKLQQQEIPILQSITRSWKNRQALEKSQSAQTSAGIGITYGIAQAGVQASMSDFDKSLEDRETYNEYSDVILRSFPFDRIIKEIQDLLTESGMKRLIIFFDDFSELNFIDQCLFVDVILSPLNNSSNEAIKLKIAGYPGRVYYGKIDATKVDTISLDFSSIYAASEVQTMEASAIDYATRLLKARFAAFGENLEDYLDPATPFDQHMRLIFETTFNVPRLMGILLHTCYLDRVSKGNYIHPASIRLAAQKYYESTISQYFNRMNRFALEPFENKLDRHNQHELLICILQESRNLRKRIGDGSIGGTYFKNLRNPPTSHFIVTPTLSDVFQSLESNFLVSKYKDTRDKNGKDVCVYALYYGLTESERLTWGYPPGREYRNYFVQRCFDFTGAIHEFLSQNQTIRCHNCGKCYPMNLHALTDVVSYNSSSACPVSSSPCSSTYFRIIFSLIPTVETKNPFPHIPLLSQYTLVSCSLYVKVPPEDTGYGSHPRPHGRGTPAKLEQQQSFELYNWRCPECREGICSVVNLSDKFKPEVEQLREDLMLEQIELEILNTLDSEDRSMRAGEISSLIDVTYQLVGKRTSKLQDMALVDKSRGAEDGRMRSSITERAKSTYFEPDDNP